MRCAEEEGAIKTLGYKNNSQKRIYRWAANRASWGWRWRLMIPLC
jgi:hypothetical protein